MLPPHRQILTTPLYSPSTSFLVCPSSLPMRNRAEKVAVRWCHLTHRVNVGASVHSREPKARVADVYPYFARKRFINHSIIIKSFQTCPAHIVMCHNAKNSGNVINDHFRAKNSCDSRAQTRYALRHHQDTSSNKNEIFVFLPDTLAVRLLSSSFAFSSCKLQLSYLQIYFEA